MSPPKAAQAATGTGGRAGAQRTNKTQGDEEHSPEELLEALREARRAQRRRKKERRRYKAARACAEPAGGDPPPTAGTSKEEQPGPPQLPGGSSQAGECCNKAEGKEVSEALAPVLTGGAFATGTPAMEEDDHKSLDKDASLSNQSLATRPSAIARLTREAQSFSMASAPPAKVARVRVRRPR